MMPANTDQDRPLTIGDAEAVKTLFEKLKGGHLPASDRVREQLVTAAEHARQMYERDDGRFTTGEREAFYHGLMTGYAVAMCFSEQQEQAVEQETAT